jgi:hypothetical protein
MWPELECLVIFYTDLDISWLLATFGDEGWRAHVSSRYERGESLRVRARAIGDHREA